MKKQLNAKYDEKFPMDGKQIRDFMMKVVKMFLAILTNDLENFFKYNPDMKEFMNILKKYEDDVNDLVIR